MINTIPKSGRPERIIENAQVFDFSLTPQDMARINGLDRNYRFGDDPENINF